MAEVLVVLLRLMPDELVQVPRESFVRQREVHGVDVADRILVDADDVLLDVVHRGGDVVRHGELIGPGREVGGGVLRVRTLREALHVALEIGEDVVQIRHALDGGGFFKVRVRHEDGPDIIVAFLGRLGEELEDLLDGHVRAAVVPYKGSVVVGAIGIIADAWIIDFFIPDDSLKGSSKAQYLSSWNRFIKTAEFYHYPLKEVTSKVIQRHYNELYEQGVSSNAIRYANLLMKKFFKYIDTECLGRNITASLSVPKGNVQKKSQEIIVWEDDEISRILGCLDQADSRFRFRLLIVLAYYTGCRIGEILGLTYEDFQDGLLRVNKQHARELDFDEDGNIKAKYDINEPKTANSIRKIPLHKTVLSELSIHKQWHLKEQLKNGYRTDYLFTTSSGKLYEPSNVRTALNRYYKKIGVEEKNIHAYRHTFGTNLCRQGVPIQTASKLLGHDDISTTAKYYVNVSADEKARAIETLELILAVPC